PHRPPRRPGQGGRSHRPRHARPRRRRAALRLQALARPLLDPLRSTTARNDAVNIQTVPSIPLFQSVPKRRRWDVARLTEEVDVPAGQRLTVQGGYAQEFFIVVEGSADVYRDGEQVATVEAGEFFGEVGLLDGGGERTATVVARSPMRLLVLARTQF